MFVLCSLFCHYDRVKDFTKQTWLFWEIEQAMLGSRTNQWQQTSPELQDNPAWLTVSSAVALWWTAGFSITHNWTAVKLLQCLHRFADPHSEKPNSMGWWRVYFAIFCFWKATWRCPVKLALKTLQLSKKWYFSFPLPVQQDACQYIFH